MSDKEDKALAKIRTLAAEGKVRFASSDSVEMYRAEVDAILKAVGVSRAWVSDESDVSDFCPGDIAYDAFLEQIAGKLGVQINAGDSRVLAVARRMREKSLSHGN